MFSTIKIVLDIEKENFSLLPANSSRYEFPIAYYVIVPIFSCALVCGHSIIIYYCENPFERAAESL